MLIKTENKHTYKIIFETGSDGYTAGYKRQNTRTHKVMQTKGIKKIK